MKSERVLDFKVHRNESENCVTIHINGKTFVMGRCAVLSLAKTLQDSVNDWAFRYASGSEAVGKVT